MSVLSAATASGRQFYQGQPNITATTLYTAPAANANVTSPSATAYIKEIVVTNTAATSQVINIHLVPNAGAAAVSNALWYQFSVPANTTNIFSLNTMVPAGAMIQALQGTAGNITVTISGVEVQ